MRQRAQDMRKLQDERVQRYSMVLRGLAEEGQLHRQLHMPETGHRQDCGKS
jgi:hypothetical protein